MQHETADGPHRPKTKGVHCQMALLPSGWARNVRLYLQDGVLATVTAETAPAPDDERLTVVLPGLPNLHSHAFQRGMAGLSEWGNGRESHFWSWRQVMYSFAERLTPEDLEAIAAMAFMEMLETGFTRVGEFHYVHHDVGGQRYGNLAEMSCRIIAAAAETGIGLTLLPVFYGRNGFDDAPPDTPQIRFMTHVDEYAALIEKARAALAGLEGAVLGIAPHSLRAASPAQLRAVLPLGQDAPVHIHIAEQIKEVNECEARYRNRPVAWLLEEMPVDHRWCLVHATHVSPAELEQLARRRAVAGLCPVTEANLGDGLFPAKAFFDAGGVFGIGSDSNVLINMPEELRLLEYGQRLRSHKRNVLSTTEHSTGRLLFTQAGHGGAQALGAACGLAAGAPADFLTLRLDHSSFLGRSGDAILDSLIFATATGMIDDVWRGGRKVVSEGRHLHRPAIAGRYRTALTRILAS